MFTDLAGDNGLMMSALLKQLSTNKTDFSNLPLLLYCAKPEQNLLTQYQQNVRPKMPRHPTSLLILDKAPAEKCTLPPYDLILASKSLHYSQSLWNNATVSFEDNLLTKLISSLTETGCLAVILPSGMPTNLNGKYGLLANHQAFEDIMYPHVLAMQGEKNTSNRDRKNFTNAESFEYVLARYASIYEEKTVKKLSIQSQETMAIVPLGEINFTADAISGKYLQTDQRAKLLLNFYTKGHYDELPATAQKEILSFISENKTLEGHHIMCHVNRIFLICPTENLQNCAETTIANTVKF